MRFFKLPNYKLTLLLFALLPLFSSNLFSNEIDTRGREFYLTFLPNFHNSVFFGEGAQLLDSLYIYVSADNPTNGTISYNRPDGRPTQVSFAITNPDEIYTFGIPYEGIELEGINNVEFIDQSGPTDNEVITEKSFFIQTDDDVTVYAHQQAITSSESMTVLPADALGTEYYIMNYNSDVTWNPFTGPSTNSTPSQFAVVARENNTRVTINPSVATARNGTAIQEITLNEGEVYLVQSRLTPDNPGLDLTGSKVTSDKPIAIFTGHQRAMLPINSNGVSRDMLLEQLPPVSTWGNTAIATPFAVPSVINTNESDFVRIMSGSDNNNITVSGFPFDVLDEGEFIQLPLNEAFIIQGTGPIMVLQYKKSSLADNSQADTFGDPLMLYLPPAQQFGNYSKSINIQASEPINSLDRVYTEHYITVISRTNDIANIKLDGNFLNPANFTNIPNSIWSYSNIRVSEGNHILESTTPFGTNIYGYGRANSYGYFGGMNLKIIDNKLPEILSSEDCFVVQGTVTDSTSIDSKLNIVEVSPNSDQNVNVEIDQFTPYAPVVNFNAELIDIYQDGEFELFAQDSAGGESRILYEIPGYTVDITAQDKNLNVEYRASQEFCRTYTLTNYGKFPQRVDDILFSNPDVPEITLTINGRVPGTLAPGASIEIEVCMSSDVTGNFENEIIVFGDCADREILTIEFTAQNDEIPPTITGLLDDCNEEYTIYVADSTATDFGLAEVSFEDVINCDLNIIQSTIKTATISAMVQDKFQDASFKIIAIDSVGQRTEFEAVIPGYTLEINGVTPISDASNQSNVYSFENTEIGILNCKFVTLNNYGSYPITLENLYFLSQLDYSLPTNQLPLIIEGGESIDLEICYRPVLSDEEFDRDTLIFSYNCINLPLSVEGFPEDLLFELDSKCDIPIELTANKVSDKFIMEQNAPNPGSIETQIDYSIPEASLVKLDIYNSYGQLVKNVFGEIHNRGIYRVNIDISDLPNGIYFYVMSTRDKQLTKQMLIAR